MICRRCQRDFTANAFDPTRRGDRLKKVCRECCKELSAEAKVARRRQGDRERRLGKGNTYRSRNAYLREIGFASYAEYLASDLWKSIRELVFKVKGRQCFLCGKAANQLHHNRYRPCDLLGKKLRHIHPICGECHKSIEFRDGDKSTVGQAKMAFNRRRKEHRGK
jgi:uncharacterized CHY-type Zn-finger protein